MSPRDEVLADDGQGAQPPSMPMLGAQLSETIKRMMEDLESPREVKSKERTDPDPDATTTESTSVGAQLSETIGRMMLDLDNRISESDIRIENSDSVDDGILPDEPPPSSSLQGSLVAPPRQDDGGLDAAAQAGADERKDSSGPSEEKDAEILAAAAAAGAGASAGAGAAAAAAAAADDDDTQQRQDGGIGDSSPEPAVTPEPASEMDAAGGSKTSASKKPTKRGADIVSARNAEDVDADEIMNPKRDTSEKEAGPAAVGKDKETPKASAKGAKSERSTPPEKRVSPGRSFMNALAGSLWRQSKPKTRGVRHIHSPGLSRQAQHFFVDLGASRSLSLATC